MCSYTGVAHTCMSYVGVHRGHRGPHMLKGCRVTLTVQRPLHGIAAVNVYTGLRNVEKGCLIQSQDEGRHHDRSDDRHQCHDDHHHVTVALMRDAAASPHFWHLHLPGRPSRATWVWARNHEHIVHTAHTLTLALPSSSSWRLFVDERCTRLVIFFLGHPHLLE